MKLLKLKDEMRHYYADKDELLWFGVTSYERVWRKKGHYFIPPADQSQVTSGM